MACFIVPAAEAVVTTVIEKAVQSKEAKWESGPIVLNGEKRVPFSRKLRWLNHMLWGGAALLAFEHVWHGEVVPFFPFLTAAGSAENAAAMLHEMATVGAAMAAVVTVAWLGMVAVSGVIEKRPLDAVGMGSVK